MNKAKKPGDRPVVYSGWSAIVHDKDRTACKHGTGDCELCGTNNRVDQRHTTIKGKGHVARLRDKK